MRLPASTSRNSQAGLRCHPTAPANEVISYKEVVFDSSVQNDQTLYQGTPQLRSENNALWHDNKVGISRVPASSAERLEVSPVPVPGQEDKSFVQMDVFHHMNYLNMIRLLLWARSSPEGLHLNTTHHGDIEEDSMSHIDHCVDKIRQYIMCHVDTTPLVWQWSKKNKEYLTYMSMKHTCVRAGTSHMSGLRGIGASGTIIGTKYVPGSPEWEDTKARVKRMKPIPRRS